MGFRFIVSVYLIIFLPAIVKAQDKYVKDKCTKEQDTILHKQVYTYADTMPKPLIGLDKLYEAVDEAIKYSPPYDELEGHVYIAFVIEKNGKADAFRALKTLPMKNTFSQIK